MKLNQLTDKIWVIDNFLSEKECEDLISFSELKGIRDNYRLIYDDQELADKLWEKLKPFCPQRLDNSDVVGLNERFRFYRYQEYQRFKKKIDGRFKKSETEESRITFLIFLNDEYQGGETKFNDVLIKPELGKALCFIHEQKHEGASVLEGTKYVLRSDVMYRKNS